MLGGERGDKKMKIVIKMLLYSSMLIFISFYLFPTKQVSAHFSDTATIEAGIKLTLGNLALSPENDETLTGLTYSGGDPVTLSTPHLRNKGTLNGKLAYQIQVTEKGTDTPANVSKMQVIMSFDSVLGDKTISASEINSSRYTFIKDNEGKEWIFDANQKEDLPVTIKYKSTDIPEKDCEIDIAVTFLLVQTNASEPKETMFYDKVSFKHEVQLKTKAEEVPDPTDPEYWPAADDKNWKNKGEVRYNDAQFEPIMYFSEVENSDRVHNLNDNVLYIELPEGKYKEDNVFGITQTEGSHIKAEIRENKRHIKLTFSFDTLNKYSENVISQPNYYTVGFNYGENNSSYVNFQPDLLPLVFKRILLNTDENIPKSFKVLPIYSTLEPQKVTFKYAKENDLGNDNYLNHPLVDAVFSSHTLSAAISKEASLFDLSLHKTSEGNNQDYLLINTSKAVKPADLNKKGKLKILITGNSGKSLVLYRDLYIIKETKQMIASKAISQNESDLKVEESQTEQEEPVVEKQVDSEKQILSNQYPSSEKQIAEDSSVTVSKEEAMEETLPSTESIPENLVSAGENQDIDKEAPIQENESEVITLENEIKIDTSPPEDPSNN